MRKHFIFVVVLLFCALFVDAQDVVTVGDTNIYMFNPVPQNMKMRTGNVFPNGILVQQYIPDDTVTVYGVALTFKNQYDVPGCAHGAFGRDERRASKSLSLLQVFALFGHYLAGPVSC